MLFIASDHAGFQLKSSMTKKFKEHHMEYRDLGTQSEESTDYPDFAKVLCLEVLKTKDAFGILICGTGVGMSIAANKFRGIRAACVSEEKSAEMARAHNNAQVLCLGARIIDEEKAWKCIRQFLDTNFDSNHPRHQRRIQKINEIEKEFGEK